MSSFQAGVTTGLNVSSAAEGTGWEVVDDDEVVVGAGWEGGWGLLLEGLLLLGLDGLLSECKGG
jgi:hypothetical protein